MKKITDFTKKYWVMILIALAIILYIINLFLKGQSPVVAPNITTQRASYNNIIPGVSSEEDLTKVLGNPLRTNISGSVKTDEFKSTSELRHHIATIQSGKVIFFKEIKSANDTAKADSLVNIYGVAPNILYSKFSNATFNLYVYPSNGIAYLGSSDGALLEIWYFEPTSIDKFIAQWGQDYSISPSTEITQ